MKATKIDYIISAMLLITIFSIFFFVGCSDSTSVADAACIETEDNPCPDYDDETVIKVF